MRRRSQAIFKAAAHNDIDVSLMKEQDTVWLDNRRLVSNVSWYLSKHEGSVKYSVRINILSAFFITSQMMIVDLLTHPLTNDQSGADNESRDPVTDW